MLEEMERPEGQRKRRDRNGPDGGPRRDQGKEIPYIRDGEVLTACQAACPVKINIPRMLIGLRELQHHGKPRRWEGLAYQVWRAVLRRPWLYRLGLRCARLLLRPLAKDGWLRRLPGPGAGWTSLRDFPAPAARSFRERWKEI